MGKIGQELISERGIDRDLFCECCGYNLRTLRLIGRCPECGGEYDTRPMNVRGILSVKDLTVPGDLIGALIVSGSLAYLILSVAVRYTILWAHLLGFPFALLFCFLFVAVFRRMLRMVRHRALLRRAEGGRGDPP